MSLAHGVLGFLNYGRMSGYDLAKAFSSSVQFFWNAQNSQIYLVLDKLEKQGFATHELVIQTDKPSKKLYSITDAGRAEFLRWLAAPNESISVEFKSAFLMKVFSPATGRPRKTWKCSGLSSTIAARFWLPWSPFPPAFSGTVRRCLPRPRCTGSLTPILGIATSRCAWNGRSGA